MKAKNMMTTSVGAVVQDDTVERAVKLMLDHHISALPVMDNDKNLVGLISEGDLMRRLRDQDAPAAVGGWNCSRLLVDRQRTS